VYLDDADDEVSLTDMTVYRRAGPVGFKLRAEREEEEKQQKSTVSDDSLDSFMSTVKEELASEPTTKDSMTDDDGVPPSSPTPITDTNANTDATPTSAPPLSRQELVAFASSVLRGVDAEALDDATLELLLGERLQGARAHLAEMARGAEAGAEAGEEADSNANASVSVSSKPDTSSQQQQQQQQPTPTTTSTSISSSGAATGYIYADDDELDEQDYEDLTAALTATKTAVVKHKDLSVLKLQPEEDRIEFQKKLYIEHPDITNLSNDQVQELKKSDNIKIRGVNVPKPVLEWSQCGFPLKIDQLLAKTGCSSPFAIQRHSLPVVLSGRDCIACAKTGSGKTLAFLLPLLRHVMAQPAPRPGDGPVAMVLTPTRELAVQTSSVARQYATALGLRVVAAYGGHNISEQIAQCKAGCEVMVGTPGRVIDLLTVNRGKVMGLSRVTYLVLDEADRMFDMGFEPQILLIVNNTRPDRQTVLFSATFPKSIENLARKVLTRPVEIVMGAKSSTAENIRQVVEVLEPHHRLLRLLQLLGEWHSPDRNILIFAETQDTVDMLFTQLMQHGYRCLAIHGGMEQADRDCAVADFKRKVTTVMVGTSIVARGLDVPSLELVVNYDCPSHLEDYVHRIGRTGRAGRRGTAVTMVTPADEAKTVDLVKVLDANKQTVSPALRALCDGYTAKVQRKEVVHYSRSGYTSAGYTFTTEENVAALSKKKLAQSLVGSDDGVGAEAAAAADAATATAEMRTKAEEREKRRVAALAEDRMRAEELERRQAEAKARVKAEAEAKEAERRSKEASTAATAAASAPASASASASATSPASPPTTTTSTSPPPAPAPAPAAPSAPLDPAAIRERARLAAQQRIAQRKLNPAPAPAPVPASRPAAPKRDAAEMNAAMSAAMAAAAKLSAKVGGSTGSGGTARAELPVNHYANHARWLVLKKDILDGLMDEHNVSIVIKGVHLPPGKTPAFGEEPLYVLIEGDNAENVRRTRSELHRRMEDAHTQAMQAQAQQSSGKYSIM
jgi:ATP-dependent RNA helicase DDX46/PRP5